MKVELMIDGEKIELVESGKTDRGTYTNFEEPEPYHSQGIGKSPFIASVFVRPGWKPSTDKKKR